MKTFYEIIGENTYRQLTTTQKEMIQNRQTELVKNWQDETNEFRKAEIFDELFDSFKGLIKGMAYRQAEKSFSVEQEDFEGIMNLELVETLLSFDRSLNIPFQPVFIMNVKNSIKMMYRQKGYDLHDEATELDKPVHKDQARMNGVVTFGETVADETPAIENLETAVVTEELLNGCFGDDEKRKTVVNMAISDFKRNEIVSAINTEGKNPESIARYVNRTLTQFKQYCLNLGEFKLS